MCNFPLNKFFRIDRRIDVLKSAKNKIMFIVTRRLIFNLFYDPGIIQKLKSTRAFAIVHLQVKVTQQNPPRKRHQAGSMYEWIIVIYLKYKKVQKFREIIFHIKNSAKKVQFDI